MNDLKYIKPFECPLSDFPSSPELPEGVKTISISDTFGYIVEMSPNVQYAERDGEKLHIQILTPLIMECETRKYPLVVFVQGSAWHPQPIFQHMQHMVRVCEKGYVAAIVQYRPSDVAPFPAQMRDAKTAIRFLRKNAEQYKIDPQHVALWGESSGAHTAVMAGITGDSEPDTEDYAEYSCAVKCIVDWYSPIDISKMNCYPSMQDHTQADSPEGYIIGRKNVLDHPELVAPMIPMNYITAERDTPPILIMHGSKDQLVPFNQSCRFYERLRELNKTVEMYKLENGYHAFGGFNSEKAIDISLEFISRYI